MAWDSIPSALLPTDLKWLSRAIGEIYFVTGTAANGYDHPPKDSDLFRFALLTAGEDGSGEYNEGILTSESVTGSAPLVVATAVVSLSGSPLNGRTINLINTEKRVLRASTSPGTVENDQMQGHKHDIGSTRTFDAAGYAPWVLDGPSNLAIEGYGALIVPDGTNGTPRTGTETRGKNLQGVAYMRIK